MSIEFTIAANVIDYIAEVSKTQHVDINKVAAYINARLCTATEPELHVDGVKMGAVMAEQINGAGK